MSGAYISIFFKVVTILCFHMFSGRKLIFLLLIMRRATENFVNTQKKIIVHIHICLTVNTIQRKFTTQTMFQTLQIAISSFKRKEYFKILEYSVSPAVFFTPKLGFLSEKKLWCLIIIFSECKNFSASKELFSIFII